MILENKIAKILDFDHSQDVPQKFVLIWYVLADRFVYHV